MVYLKLDNLTDAEVKSAINTWVEEVETGFLEP
jgi:hypothetical protein